MSFADRIRGFFSKRGNPELGALEDFAARHQGVEGYIEPRTATNPTTLLLVDRRGEHVRGAVRDPADAISFCDRLGIPVYDAQVIGYPKRMRNPGAPQPADALESEIAELERRLREEGPDVPDH